MRMLYTWIVLSLWTFWLYGQAISTIIPSSGTMTYGSHTRVKRDDCIGPVICGHESPSRKTIENGTLLPHALYRYCYYTDGKYLFVTSCKYSCKKLYISSCAPCSPNSEHCGYDMQASFSDLKDRIFIGARYLCSSNGNDFTVTKDCDPRCHCFPSVRCTPNKRYCTNQLLQRDIGNKEVSAESIWLCTNDKTVVRVQQCERGCMSDNDGPRCVSKCESFRLYCGSELHGFGWTGGDPNHLYQCTERGGINQVSVCENKVCVTPSNGNSTCIGTCRMGQEYCGRDLAKLEGWADRVTVEQQKHIQQCTVYNMFEELQYCRYGCSSSGPTPHCSCKVGVAYCGYELQELKWPDVKGHSLYRCNAENNITEISPCKECQKESPNSYCSKKECVDGSLYCGWQLQRSKSDLNFNSDGIYGCREGEPYFTDKTCNHHCVPATKTTALYCSEDTVEGKLYCGHQLGFQGQEARNLYLFVNGTRFINATCSGDCEVVEPDTSQCSSNPADSTR